ncbi:hypothetical protein APHAL10511_000044 [Amanita phalloides]|nr:hypothetical protein APHAL10511_000044 [Amanita phalloides]
MNTCYIYTWPLGLQTHLWPLTTNTLKPSVPRLSIHTTFQGEKLDQLKSNWTTWNPDILIALTLNGLDEYIEGTLTQPNATSEPRTHANWKANNQLAHGFLLQYIDSRERDHVKDTTSAKACWDALKNRHEKEGPVGQLQLLTQALQMTFLNDKTLPKTAAVMDDLISRAFVAGDITRDVITSLVFLHGMNSLPHLQSVINHNLSMATKEKPYKPTDILRLLENEQRLCDTGRNPTTSTSIALTTKSSCQCPTCSNCKKLGHIADYCISSGGGMVGKTIEESRKAAQVAQEAKRNKGTTTNNRPKLHVIDPNSGKAYMLEIDTADILNDNTSFVSIASTTSDNIQTSLNSIEYEGWLAAKEEPRTSVDWTIKSHDQNHSFALSASANGPAFPLTSHPFYCDSGAMVHISPDKNDFENLKTLHYWSHIKPN